MKKADGNKNYSLIIKIIKTIVNVRNKQYYFV